jgi:hypothetical protein
MVRGQGMRYYKIIDSNYLVFIGVGNGGLEITETEYNSLFEIINNKPTAPTGYDYKLTKELEWELYELPQAEPEEMDETEEKALAYDILTGVAE